MASTDAVTNRAPMFRLDRRDQVSALLTLAVAVLAIAAGVLWREAVERRTSTYTHSSGLTIAYPERWRLDDTASDAGIVRASDTSATDYPTTLELRWIAVAEDATDAEALGAVANTLALNRARELPSFKLLALETGRTLTAQSLPGAVASYVFVHDATGVFQEGIPTVVLGEDRLVRKGGTVHVFSLLAAHTNRKNADGVFRAFVDSARLP